MSFSEHHSEAETLLDRYSDMVLRIAVHNVGSLPDAEDVAQEVFLKRFTARRAFDSPEHEKAWMIRVTLNQCRDFLKAAHRKNVTLDENIPSEDPDIEVLDAVLRLPVDFRNVIYLHYYEGMSVSEMARILRRGENTVSSRLHRAREALKSALTGGFGDE